MQLVTISLHRFSWAVFVFLGLAALPQIAVAQLSIPTTGVLPSAPLTQSIILGDNLTELQTEWQAPVNAYQQSWVNSINSRANSAVSGSVPTDFPTAALDSSIAESAGLRYAMTGDASDLNKTVTALLDAALPAQNDNDFITFPELLTSYLSAYDYIRAAPASALPAATRATIETRLTGLAQGLVDSNGTLSNALAKIGATQALAGELLNNKTLLNTGLSDLQKNFNYSTTNDGWYTDSQTVYLDYISRHLALFARAYQQGSGVNLYPNVQPLMNLSMAMRMPDGTVPNVSDGLNWPVATQLFTNTPDKAAAGLMLWNFEQLPVNAFDQTNIDNNDYSNSTSFALTNFSVKPTAPTQSPTFLPTGQSGVTVFRNDWSTTSNYLMMSPGVDSPFVQTSIPSITIPAFHDHNDTGEILVASQGHYMLVAPGDNRTDLSNSPPGFASQIPTNHNVILVDGDLGNTSEGAEMLASRFTNTDRLDSDERGGSKGVSDFSTLKMTYGGANVSRSTAFPNENYFVVADRMQSTTSHSYGFNLIGRGTMTTLTNTPNLIEVKWEQDGAEVVEHLVSTQAMSLLTASTYMQNEFNQYEVTQRIDATIHGSNANFLSVIETIPAGSAPQLAIVNLSTTAYAAMQVTSASDGYVDWILSQAASAVRTVGPMTTDAEYGYLRHVAGALDSAMMARGSYLADGNRSLLQANNPITMSLLFGASTLRATISADNYTAGTVLDLFNLRILSATLNGQPIAFSNQGGTGELFLTGAGDLQVNFSSVPEPSSVVMLGIGLTTIWGARRWRRPQASSARSR